jgi:broad specificity phosphatase PhoE
MGTLYLVRHGQASFGAADYDQLSELGERQCRRLGEYFRLRGRRFQAVLRGTLKRQQQSLAALLQGLGEAHEPAVHAALDEYDSGALVRAIHDGPAPQGSGPDAYRHHMRLLRQGLQAWMDGHSTPSGMPSHADFVAGIVAVLDRVRADHDGDVLLVSSGGPISNAVARVLGVTAAATTIELNLRLRNTSVTEFSFNPRRHVLHSFNHLPHLDGPDYDGWHTYS